MRNTQQNLLRKKLSTCAPCLNAQKPETISSLQPLRPEVSPLLGG